ncbi:hypothetical protein EJ08DRAFT_230945 [Tothia fuscella]|uniref:Transcription factor IIIC 90kDa subunit N-terminal domain-containing protein n=1 Tax=Tothia fuscella TaxID=1048955 RepID=A0A9P4U4Q8_9PEZI|nr:hypothetical protein EJ08DRAFT_230945 [Tothia fuscella]
MEDTVLGVEPSELNCVTWSETGDIAVAAGEHVEILIAKTRRSDDPNKLWEFVHLRTNEFSEEEIATTEPTAFAVFSVGEELSNGEATALDWSPLGLTKHRRCGLAVLTQNRALSLWVPGVDPRSQYGWARERIVNLDIARYHEKLSEGEESRYTPENLTQFQRVRAFTWSPPAFLRASKSEKGSAGQEWRNHFLAVANDYNEIVILWVPSYHKDSTLAGTALESEALAHFSISATEHKVPDLSWTFEDYMENNHAATHVAWSPFARWEPDGSLLSIIAYATPTKVGFRQVNISLTEEGRPHIQIGDFIANSAFPKSGTVGGSLRWLPKISEKGRMQLFTSVGSTVFRYDLAAIGNIDIKRSAFVRKEWDPVSTLIFTESSKAAVELQIPSHISITETSCTTLDLKSFKPSKADKNATWKAKTLQHKDLYDKEKRLGGQVAVKLWGMAATPNGHLIATNFSLHPSKTLEYQITSDAWSTLTVNVASAELDLPSIVRKSFDGNFNPELLALIIKVTLSTQTLQERQTITRKILEAVDAISLEPKATHTLPQDPTTRLKKIFQTPGMRKQRLQRLIQVVGTTEEDEDGRPIHCPINADGPPTEQLLSVAMLNISSSFTTSSDKSRDLVKSYLMASLLQLNQPKDGTGTDEKCEICDAGIPFENLTIAKCLEGHEFVRCALTFLAVQAPGISKFCGLCERQYLTETILEPEGPQAEIEEEDVDMIVVGGSSNSHGKKEPPDFGRVLFASCEDCIYCGGKFVG